GPSPAPDTGRELAPPTSPVGPVLAPPDSDEEPLRGDKNQEPAAGGPAGFSQAQPGKKTPESESPIPVVAPVSIPAAATGPAAAETPAPRSAVGPGGLADRPKPAPGKPDLRHVVPEDLADTGRLLELYAQAVAAGLVPASEWGRLRFVAAAEHA